MFTKNQIEELYNKYLEIIKWEIEELGCKETELRHLIGRLGEFYCAKYVNGTLAQVPNQQGFDVLKDNGKTISVKTTAQKNGFVSINLSTIHKAEELMVLQLKDLKIQIIYYGPMSIVKSNSRSWKGHIELDISKAKRIYPSLIKINDIELRLESENKPNRNTLDFYFSVVDKKNYLKIMNTNDESATDYYIFDIDNWKKADYNQLKRDSFETTAEWTQLDKTAYKF